VVPREAIFDDGAKGGKPYVFVRNAAGAWDRREVELGAQNHHEVAVKSGLKADEVVALERPGQAKATIEQAMLRSRPVELWAEVRRVWAGLA
jgi:multidrug efflux pump subunit AcrA (membrane-fusion protein)